ncbi:hypothetical protein B0H13DRAFT_2266803 [Mycena leptocephala]|nr:hypothetical protein B0H13DRAFT_2266803 [Mycena leptocephala]
MLGVDLYVNGIMVNSSAGYKARLTPRMETLPVGHDFRLLCYFALDGIQYMALRQGSAGFSFREDRDRDGIPKSVFLGVEDQSTFLANIELLTSGVASEPNKWL